MFQKKIVYYHESSAQSLLRLSRPLSIGCRLSRSKAESGGWGLGGSSKPCGFFNEKFLSHSILSHCAFGDAVLCF